MQRTFVFAKVDGTATNIDAHTALFWRGFRLMPIRRSVYSLSRRSVYSLFRRSVYSSSRRSVYSSSRRSVYSLSRRSVYSLSRRSVYSSSRRSAYSTCRKLAPSPASGRKVWPFSFGGRQATDSPVIKSADSITLPPLRITSRSAICKVCGRCAIVMRVMLRPFTA